MIITIFAKSSENDDKLRTKTDLAKPRKVQFNICTN